MDPNHQLNTPVSHEGPQGVYLFPDGPETVYYNDSPAGFQGSGLVVTPYVVPGDILLGG